MRIGIDSTYLDVSYKTGIYYYLKNLLLSLSQVDKSNDYFLFYNSFVRSSKSFFSPGNNFKKKIIRIPNIIERVFGRELFFNLYQRSLLNSIRRNEIDVFHFPHLKTPYLSDKYSIVTINDIAFLALDEYRNLTEANFLNKQLHFCKNSANKIIAISNFTKQEIIKHTSISENKIEVVCYGRDHLFQHIGIANSERVKISLSLPKKYILYVGSIEPRKNIETLIETFYILKKKYNLEHKLVIVGSKGVKGEQVLKKVSSRLRDLNDEVVFKGIVDNSNLVFFYNLADVFVTCSYYEGFGLPLLEALGCGCPVVCSDIPVFREVAGDGALFSLPFDYDSFATNIYNILNDKELRKDVAKKAFLQKDNFSWHKAAVKMKEIYETRS